MKDRVQSSSEYLLSLDSLSNSYGLCFSMSLVIFLVLILALTVAALLGFLSDW